MDYRTEVYRLKMDRRDLAQKLNVAYSTLSSRLNGFSRLNPREESILQDEIRKAQKGVR